VSVIVLTNGATHHKAVAEGREKEEDEMALSMRRIFSVLAVAALTAAMVLGGAGSALAKERAHCTTNQEDPYELETCAGGSGEQGGGGGGQKETIAYRGEDPYADVTTGGGSNFRGTGEGGGGHICISSADGSVVYPCYFGKGGLNKDAPIYR
jgi:hypothetical protein